MLLLRPALLLAGLLPVLASTASHGSPLNFDLGEYSPPAVLQDNAKVPACTVAYLIEDFAANQTFLARMHFTPAPNAVAVKGRLPCPALVPPRVAQAALDGCRDHAGKKTDCVFADMSRGFAASPVISNTAENASRCGSDQALQIAIACGQSGQLDVCNVACGDTAAAAIATARGRCEAKHQRSCPITGVLPVRAP
jgi:hypothetical protein